MKSTQFALGASLAFNLTAVVMAGALLNGAIKDAERVQKLEADVRTYAGKYLDLQEKTQDEDFSVRSQVTTLQLQLGQCESNLKVDKAAR